MPDDQFWWLHVTDWHFAVTDSGEDAWGYYEPGVGWIHGRGQMPPLFRRVERMQTYKSHKVVEAAEILSAMPNPYGPGAIFHLRGEKTTVALPPEWILRHSRGTQSLEAFVGGYLVRYDDGYVSWSPKEAFESGYTKVTVVTDAEMASLAGEHILQFFAFNHLPPHLQEISRPFCEMAVRIMHEPRNPERTVALRKLLESKDACVRARIAGPMPMIADHPVATRQTPQPSTPVRPQDGIPKLVEDNPFPSEQP